LGSAEELRVNIWPPVCLTNGRCGELDANTVAWSNYVRKREKREELW